MTAWDRETWDALAKIRQKRPLIHNITNFVVMNTTANTILAVGASPIMAHAIQEVGEIAAFSGAVLLNIGTLETDWIDAMITAGKSANARGIPVILDPVGVGATRFRSESAGRLMAEVEFAIIRGNAAEIFALAGFHSRIQGVDSLQDSQEIKSKAVEIAAELHSVVAITGAEDLVSDGRNCYGISGGDPIFKQVTGTGCAASAICACFAAVEPLYLKAAAMALAYYKSAGEEAARLSKGPGSFQMQLFDALANTSRASMENSIRIRQL
jgi:hydroxyethylthiazole kinase